MWDFLSKIVEKVPARLVGLLLSLTLGAIFAWFLTLAGAALLTNRQVEFYPPKITADPQIKAELKALTDRLNQTIKQEQDHRDNLSGVVIAFHTAAADTRQKNQDKAADEYRIAAEKVEAQIKQSEDRLAELLSSLESQLVFLNGRF